jgi:hydrogenase-4 component B
VFGTLLFQARERVELPPPGDPRPARLTSSLRDLLWDGIYLPLAAGISGAADILNRLQFLTIRQYLSFVFVVLVALLLLVSVWA